MLSYKISKNNTVEVWEEGNTEYPMLRQPHFPNGDSWTKEEATFWANVFISQFNDSGYSYRPGPSRENPIIKVEKEEAPLEEALVEEAPEEATEEAPAE